MTPRRVLLISDHFHPVVGGAETLSHALARGLVAGGEEVWVLTQRVPRAAPAEERRDGYTIRRLWVPRMLGRLWFMLVAGFYAAARAPRVDVIHAAGYASMWPGRFAAWWRRVPAVVTVYEVLGENWFSTSGLPRRLAALFRSWERSLMRLDFARHLSISRYTADRLTRLAGVSPDRIDVVYPPVDYDFWQAGRYSARPLHKELGLEPDCRIALFLGRPGMSKGVDMLLASAAERFVASHGLRAHASILESVLRQPAGSSLGAPLPPVYDLQRHWAACGPPMTACSAGDVFFHQPALKRIRMRRW